ncbi:hypothetical protein AK95_13230 [Paenibacillus sp. LC231]|uniref:hypothetical protein n=1 Tax=Paenibacillus sp. LC231 TaxID=1120679 RepID=UPI0008DE1896|nr:hypothetical protein [Paenibacillus sp. LC231]OIB04572.1 hypothetical protein AK95_13230 [Paenibacillus sp. LC231]
MATQEIGITLDFPKGSFDNLIFTNNTLQLIEETKDDAGNGVYRDSGSWVSEVIFIKDKVTSFKRISRNVAIKGSGSYKIYTSSSPDQLNWTPWTEINYTDGSISTPADQYAKVKIEVFAHKTNATFTVDDFNIPDKYSNPFLNSSDGVLELKNLYRLVGEKEINWNDTGKLFITKINKSYFKAINKIEVV